MKDFLKQVGATLVGLVIFCVAAAVLSLVGLMGMLVSSSSNKTLDKNSVLVLRLDGKLTEQGGSSIWGELNGESSLSLSDMLSAINKAKTNDRVKGIYVEGGNFDVSVAQASELRAALADFKKSGKWILAYADQYDAVTYYVASVADKVYLNPVGALDWHGFSGQRIYLKGLADKLGISVVPLKCGKYKSALETFTNTRMSDADRQQTSRYVQGLWNEVVTAVSKSRHISADTLNAYADRYVGLEVTRNLLKYKMVDELLYADQLKTIVKERLGMDSTATVSQITPADMAALPMDTDGGQVAVYYAEGDIVDSADPMAQAQGEQFIVGDRVVDDLDKLADDDDVKAVVMRLNTGGGSGYASEQIWHALMRLRAKKPVVVSMSGMAASGGYYVSTAANYVVAEPATLTGSIGVFSMHVDKTKLFNEKLGITTDAVVTNRNALLGSEITPMTNEQNALMQASVNQFYKLFKQRVAQGRHLTMDRVEQLAQGHVYLGSDAKDLGLVDALGGLGLAVTQAARLAKLDSWHTAAYPDVEDMWSQLLDMATGTTRSRLDEQLRATLGAYYVPFMQMRALSGLKGVQARLPYFLIIK